MRVVGIILIIASITIGSMALFPAYAPEWTGFGEYNIDPAKARAKTLWDWLDLLIVPIVLAVLAGFLRASQREIDRSRELERYLNEALSSFIERMTRLILEKDLLEKPTKKVQGIARTEIVLALNLLDSRRKGYLMQFLYESHLILTDPIVSMIGSDLSEALLDKIVLKGSELKGVKFNDASIQAANLSEANFCGSNFSNANLANSILQGADFSYANLINANLSNIDLTKTNLFYADLGCADLTGSRITQKQIELLKNHQGMKCNKNLVK